MTNTAVKAKQMNSSAESKRRPEAELLRCVAMMMVIILHFLSKGKILGTLSDGEMNGIRITAWLLESFAIGAVNLYMLLSGYFLCNSSFRITRLFQLLLQVWTYSVVVGIASVVFGIVPANTCDTYFYLQLLFPISQSHYWFLTAYVYLYLLLPLVGNAVRTMDRERFRVVLALLLITFCVMKSVFPFRFEMDQNGYDYLWYLVMFLTAAYIRRFGITVLNRKGLGLGMFVLSSLAIFGLSMLLRAFVLRTGRLELIFGVFYHYNHLLPYLASVGLFMTFMRTGRGRECGVVCRQLARLGRYTLGVYLLHENLAIRFLWPNWFGADRIASVPGLLGRLSAAVLAVFTLGVLVEFLRSRLMAVIHSILMHITVYERIIKYLEKVDGYFSLQQRQETVS